MLQYTTKRATAKGFLSVNQTTTLDHDDTMETVESEQDPIPEPEETAQEAEINTTVSQAQQEAHPGVICRVLDRMGKKKAVAQEQFASGQMRQNGMMPGEKTNTMTR